MATDVVVAGPTELTYFPGSSSGVSTDRRTQITTPGAGPIQRIACAGDIDGDGYADLVVGL